MEKCVVCVCAVCERLKNRIYTSGHENSLCKGFPRLRVFVAHLTFRRFALGSVSSGSGSGTALALDADRDGVSASASAVAWLPST